MADQGFPSHHDLPRPADENPGSRGSAPAEIFPGLSSVSCAEPRQVPLPLGGTPNPATVNAIGLVAADAFKPFTAVNTISTYCLLKLSSHCHIVNHWLWRSECESRNGITTKGTDMAESAAMPQGINNSIAWKK
jgi:hypothetical protein